eukprot:s3539_g2.t1
MQKVVELQTGLAELSEKVDTVKGENTQLREENNVLKDYLNNLMAKACQLHDGKLNRTNIFGGGKDAEPRYHSAFQGHAAAEPGWGAICQGERPHWRAYSPGGGRLKVTLPP